MQDSTHRPKAGDIVWPDGATHFNPGDPVPYSRWWGAGGGGMGTGPSTPVSRIGAGLFVSLLGLAAIVADIVIAVIRAPSWDGTATLGVVILFLFGIPMLVFGGFTIRVGLAQHRWVKRNGAAVVGTRASIIGWCGVPAAIAVAIVAIALTRGR